MSPTRPSPPTPTSPVTLKLVDLSTTDDFDEMVRQRHICGWKYSTEIIQKWRDLTRKGTQFMWWITLPIDNTDEVPIITNPGLHDSQGNDESHRADNRQRVGHISLSSELSSPEPDPDLARADRSILYINTFFILPAYRKLGLGRATMAAVEDHARQIPECRQVTVDTMDRRYITDQSPEWGGRLAAHVGPTTERRLITEDWYVRLGYERFKSSHVFTPTWNDNLMLSCLRKQIK